MSNPSIPSLTFTNSISNLSAAGTVIHTTTATATTTTDNRRETLKAATSTCVSVSGVSGVSAAAMPVCSASTAAGHNNTFTNQYNNNNNNNNNNESLPTNATVDADNADAVDDENNDDDDFNNDFMALCRSCGKASAELYDLFSTTKTHKTTTTTTTTTTTAATATATVRITGKATVSPLNTSSTTCYSHLNTHSTTSSSLPTIHVAGAVSYPAVSNSCSTTSINTQKLTGTGTGTTTTTTTTRTSAKASSSLSDNGGRGGNSNCIGESSVAFDSAAATAKVTAKGQNNMDNILQEMLIWQLQIKCDDGLPQRICPKCTAQFYYIHKFRRKCLKVQTQLRALYGDRQFKHMMSQQQQQRKETITFMETTTTMVEEVQTASTSVVVAAAATTTSTTTTKESAVLPVLASLPPSLSIPMKLHGIGNDLINDNYGQQKQQKQQKQQQPQQPLCETLSSVAFDGNIWNANDATKTTTRTILLDNVETIANKATLGQTAVTFDNKAGTATTVAVPVSIPGPASQKHTPQKCDKNNDENSMLSITNKQNKQEETQTDAKQILLDTEYFALSKEETDNIDEEDLLATHIIFKSISEKLSQEFSTSDKMSDNKLTQTRRKSWLNVPDDDEDVRGILKGANLEGQKEAQLPNCLSLSYNNNKVQSLVKEIQTSSSSSSSSSSNNSCGSNHHQEFMLLTKAALKEYSTAKTITTATPTCTTASTALSPTTTSSNDCILTPEPDRKRRKTYEREQLEVTTTTTITTTSINKTYVDQQQQQQQQQQELHADKTAIAKCIALRRNVKKDNNNVTKVWETSFLSASITRINKQAEQQQQRELTHTAGSMVQKATVTKKNIRQVFDNKHFYINDHYAENDDNRADDNDNDDEDEDEDDNTLIGSDLYSKTNQTRTKIVANDFHKGVSSLKLKQQDYGCTEGQTFKLNVKCAREQLEANKRQRKRKRALHEQHENDVRTTALPLPQITKQVLPVAMTDVGVDNKKPDNDPIDESFATDNDRQGVKPEQQHPQPPIATETNQVENENNDKRNKTPITQQAQQQLCEEEHAQEQEQQQQRQIPNEELTTTPNLYNTQDMKVTKNIQHEPDEVKDAKEAENISNHQEYASRPLISEIVTTAVSPKTSTRCNKTKPKNSSARNGLACQATTATATTAMTTTTPAVQNDNHANAVAKAQHNREGDGGGGNDVAVNNTNLMSICVAEVAYGTPATKRCRSTSPSPSPSTLTSTSALALAGGSGSDIVNNCYNSRYGNGGVSVGNGIDSAGTVHQTNEWIHNKSVWKTKAAMKANNTATTNSNDMQPKRQVSQLSYKYELLNTIEYNEQQQQQQQEQQQNVNRNDITPLTSTSIICMRSLNEMNASSSNEETVKSSVTQTTTTTTTNTYCPNEDRTRQSCEQRSSECTKFTELKDTRATATAYGRDGGRGVKRLNRLWPEEVDRKQIKLNNNNNNNNDNNDNNYHQASNSSSRPTNNNNNNNNNTDDDGCVDDDDDDDDYDNDGNGDIKIDDNENTVDHEMKIKHNVPEKRSANEREQFHNNSENDGEAKLWYAAVGAQQEDDNKNTPRLQKSEATALTPQAKYGGMKLIIKRKRGGAQFKCRREDDIVEQSTVATETTYSQKQQEQQQQHSHTGDILPQMKKHKKKRKYLKQVLSSSSSSSLWSSWSSSPSPELVKKEATTPQLITDLQEQKRKIQPQPDQTIKSNDHEMETKKEEAFASDMLVNVTKSNLVAVNGLQDGTMFTELTLNEHFLCTHNKGNDLAPDQQQQQRQKRNDIVNNTNKETVNGNAAEPHRSSSSNVSFRKEEAGKPSIKIILKKNTSSGSNKHHPRTQEGQSEVRVQPNHDWEAIENTLASNDENFIKQTSEINGSHENLYSKDNYLPSATGQLEITAKPKRADFMSCKETEGDFKYTSTTKEALITISDRMSLTADNCYNNVNLCCNVSGEPDFEATPQKLMVRVPLASLTYDFKRLHLNKNDRLRTEEVEVEEEAVQPPLPLQEEHHAKQVAQQQGQQQQAADIECQRNDFNNDRNDRNADNNCCVISAAADCSEVVGSEGCAKDDLITPLRLEKSSSSIITPINNYAGLSVSGDFLGFTPTSSSMASPSNQPSIDTQNSSPLMHTMDDADIHLPSSNKSLENDNNLCIASTKITDFINDFQTHCIDSSEIEDSSQDVLPPDLTGIVTQELSDELLDVENTLNGILNEMHDQDILTPSGPDADDFFAQSIYSPLTEPPATPAQSYYAESPNTLNTFNMMNSPYQQQTTPHSSHSSEGGGPIINNFSYSEDNYPYQQTTADNFADQTTQSAMIGFQNDIPCFENFVRTVPEGVSNEVDLINNNSGSSTINTPSIDLASVEKEEHSLTEIFSNCTNGIGEEKTTLIQPSEPNFNGQRLPEINKNIPIVNEMFINEAQQRPAHIMETSLSESVAFNECPLPPQQLPQPPPPPQPAAPVLATVPNQFVLTTTGNGTILMDRVFKPHTNATLPFVTLGQALNAKASHNQQLPLIATTPPHHPQVPTLSTIKTGHIYNAANNTVSTSAMRWPAANSFAQQVTVPSIIGHNHPHPPNTPTTGYYINVGGGLYRATTTTTTTAPAAGTLHSTSVNLNSLMIPSHHHHQQHQHQHQHQQGVTQQQKPPIIHQTHHQLTLNKMPMDNNRNYLHAQQTAQPQHHPQQQQTQPQPQQQQQRTQQYIMVLPPDYNRIAPRAAATPTAGATPQFFTATNAARITAAPSLAGSTVVLHAPATYHTNNNNNNNNNNSNNSVNSLNNNCTAPANNRLTIQFTQQPPSLQPQSQHQQHQQHQRAQQQLQQKIHQKHLQLIQPKQPGSREQQINLVCRFCHKRPKFNNNIDYSNHIIAMHPVEKPFNCPFCPQHFQRRVHRQQHIAEMHAAQRYQCPQCSLSFSAQRTLDMHLQKYHACTRPTAEGKATETMTDETQQQRSPNNTTSAARSSANGSVENSPPATYHLLEPPHHPQQRLVRVDDVQLQVTDEIKDQRTIELPVEIESERNALEGGAGNSDSSSQTKATPNIPAAVWSDDVEDKGELKCKKSQTHVTLPSPEQTEPDSTSTTTLRQFRKRRLSNSSTSSVVYGEGGNGGGADRIITNRSLRSNHKCLLCAEYFSNEIALRKHHYMVHGNHAYLPLMCNVCKQGFRTRPALLRHMETHDTEGRPYQCNVCHVRFPRPSQLTLHKLTVHKFEKSYTCEQCDQNFTSENALTMHLKCHPPAPQKRHSLLDDNENKAERTIPLNMPTIAATANITTRTIPLEATNQSTANNTNITTIQQQQQFNGLRFENSHQHQIQHQCATTNELI